MTLTMLGTGNALVTECYNTCFVLREGEQALLVDGGGGNGLLRRLRQAGIDWRCLRDIYVTHKHLDHIMGIFWMVRLICQNMAEGRYEGEATIWGHAEVIELIRQMGAQLLQPKQAAFLGGRLRLKIVEDGEEAVLLGKRVKFFDIHSTKARQFGFCLWLNETDKLTCCGDEPCPPECEEIARASKWLLHEAFCLHGEADRFHPYDKHHSTVRDAALLARRLGVRNLLLYHTEEENLAHRKALYTAEGAQYFEGSIFVPEDLEQLTL